MSDSEKKQPEIGQLQEEKHEIQVEKPIVLQGNLPTQIRQMDQKKDKELKAFHRPTKIFNSPTQQDVTILRSAKSGSIKNKLNLQNTKLRVNIQNLNVTLTLKQQNEKNMRKELDRYAQKLKKYKDRVKGKDLTIMKLMNKIQMERKQISQSFVNQHKEYIQELREKDFQNNSQLKQLFTKYQTLYGKYTQSELRRKDVNEENKQLLTIINKLKNGDEVEEFTGIREKQRQMVREREEREKEKHNQELQLKQLRTQNLQNQQKLNTIIGSLHNCENTIKEELEKICRKLAQIQNKNEQYAGIQTQILKTKDQLAYLTTQYGEETQNWMQIQSNLQQKIQKLKSMNYELQNKNQSLQSRCSILQLKIKSYVQVFFEGGQQPKQEKSQSAQNNIQKLSQQENNNYNNNNEFSFRLQKIMTASSRLKRQNLNLSQKLQTTKKAYEELVQEQQRKWEQMSFELKSSDNLIKKDNNTQELQRLTQQIHTLKQELSEANNKNQQLQSELVHYKEEYNINIIEKKSEHSLQDKVQLQHQQLQQLKNQQQQQYLGQEEHKGRKGLDKHKDNSEQQIKSMSDKQSYVIHIKSPQVEDEELQLGQLIEKYKQLTILNQGLREKNRQLQRQIRTTHHENNNNNDNENENENDNDDEQLMRQTYENINGQIQRLSGKCDNIQREKEGLITQLQQKYEEVNKQKEHSEHLTVLVMNLQQQLSKHREKENSFSHQCQGQRRGPQSRGSSNLSQIKQHQQQQFNKINNQFEELVGEIGQSNYAYNYKIKSLQNKIQQLRISLEDYEEGPIQTDNEGKKLTQSLRRTCKNCESLLQSNKMFSVRIKELQMKQEHEQEQVWQQLKQPKYDVVSIIEEKNMEIQKIKEESQRAYNHQMQANKQLIQKINKYLKEKQDIERQLNIGLTQISQKENELKGVYELVSEKDETINRIKVELQNKEEQDKRISQLLLQNNSLSTKLIEIVNSYQKIQTQIKNKGYQTVQDLLMYKDNLQEEFNKVVSEKQELIRIVQSNNNNQEGVIKKQSIKEQYKKQNTQQNLLDSSPSPNKAQKNLLDQSQPKSERNLLDQSSNDIQRIKEQNARLRQQHEHIIQQNNKILQKLQQLQIIINENNNKGNKVQTTGLSPEIEKSKDATIQSSQVKLSPFFKEQLTQLQRLTLQFNKKVSQYESQIDQCAARLGQYEKKMETNRESKDKLIQQIMRLIKYIDTLNDQSQPQFTIIMMQEYPQFTQLMTKFKVKLQIYRQIAVQKTNKMNEVFQEMKQLSLQCIKEGTQNSPPSPRQYMTQQTQQRLQQAAIIQERYEQLLTQLLTYEDLNKDFSFKLSAMKAKTNSYKQEIQSSEQLPYSEENLKKLLASEKEADEIPVLKFCLGRINQLERNLEMLQLDFDKKNNKLDSLLKKQISFQSDRKKSNDNSIEEGKKQTILIQDEEGQEKKVKKTSKVLSLMQEKERSLSYGSVKMFKEIQELSKVNEQIKEKVLNFKNVVQQSYKALTQIRKYPMGEEQANDIDNLMKMLVKSLEEGNIEHMQFRRQSSMFDFDEDQIVSGSYRQKIKKNQQPLQQIQVTFQPNKLQILQKRQQAEEKEQEEMEDKIRNEEVQKYLAQEQEKMAQKLIEKNKKFLNEHKIFMDSFLQKMKEMEEHANIDEEKIYTVLAQNLTEEELQKLIFMQQYSQAIKKIVSLLQANGGNSKQFSMSALLNKQIEDIIHNIYPQKTNLCQLVHTNILKLLSAQNNDDFLQTIFNLFSLMVEQENKTAHLLSKKDLCIRDYGVKMQKVLINKFSQDSGTDSEVLLESSFKKITEFKTQYDFRKQEVEGNEGNQGKQGNSPKEEEIQEHQ